MICPKCNNIISDYATTCPHCGNDTEQPKSFNDYKGDGFVYQENKEVETKKSVIRNNRKALDTVLSKSNIFIIALLFIVIIAVITVVGLKNTSNNANKNVIYTPTQANDDSSDKDSSNKLTPVEDVSIKDICGVWIEKSHQSNDDGYIPYYIIKENEFIIECGSITVSAPLIDFTTDKENKILIDTNDVLSGYFYYNLSITSQGESVLTLTDAQTTSARQAFCKVESSVSYEVTEPERFDSDEKLIGKWTGKQDMYYQFDDNGIFTRYVNGLTLKGTWSVISENVVELTYMNSHEIKKQISYAFTNEKLVIESIVYTKE